MGERLAGGIVLIEDGEIGWGLKFDQYGFGGEIGFDRAVPFEVILGQHGDQCDMRAPAHGAEVFEHVAGEFEDDQIIGGDLREGFEERAAYVSADVGAEFFGEHCAEHGGGGGFSLGAGDAEGALCGAALKEEADFGGDGDAGGAGGLEIDVVERNGGGGDDEAGVLEIFVAMFAQAEFDGEAGELFYGIGEGIGGVFVGYEDVSALAGEPFSDGDAAAEAAQAHNGDRTIFEVLHDGDMVAEADENAIVRGHLPDLAQPL